MDEKGDRRLHSGAYGIRGGAAVFARCAACSHGQLLRKGLPPEMGQRVWSRDEARSARASHGQEVTGFGDGLLWSPPPPGNDRNAPGDTAWRAGEWVLLG